MLGSTLPDGSIVLGAYELLSPVERSELRALYRARALADGQPLTVELLTPQTADSSVSWGEEKQRCLRVAQTFRERPHPQLERILDCGEHEGAAVMVTEALDGEDLASFIARRGALAPALAQSIIAQVLEALVFVHGQGVVHRTVTPENVVLTSLEQRLAVKLCGVARVGAFASEALPELSSRLSASFVAPELLQGLLTIQSDLYALGLVFLECLTGERTVHAETLYSALFDHSQRPSALPEQVSSGPFSGFLNTACAKSLEHRFRSATEMLDALNKLRQPSQDFELRAPVEDVQSDFEHGSSATPKPIGVCLEDLDALPSRRYLACVALAGGRAGLGLGEEGDACWQQAERTLLELWVSADERLMLFRRRSAPSAVLRRAERRLEVPEGKPVVLCDQDELEYCNKTYRLHVHGESRKVFAPEYVSALQPAKPQSHLPIEVIAHPPTPGPPTRFDELTAGSPSRYLVLGLLLALLLGGLLVFLLRLLW